VSLAVDEEADRALISVTDDGPGIPEEFQATLFERFTRADSSRARTTGSTGLGLAIVQAVVEAHGGAVSVSSVPGKTTFSVSLPLVHGVAAPDEVAVEVDSDEVDAADEATPAR
jgi:two-component system OmpR family sensor kinase